MSTKDSPNGGTLDALGTLAKCISQLHEGILGRGRANLNDAIEIGGYLVQVRGQVEHGQWIPWVKANCSFSVTTAWQYCRVFEGKFSLRKNMTLNEAKLRLGLIKDVPDAETPTEGITSPTLNAGAAHGSNLPAADLTPQIPAAAGLIPLLQRVHQHGGIGSDISAQLAGKDALSQQQIFEDACEDQEVEVVADGEIDAALATIVGNGINNILAPKKKKSGGKGDVTPAAATLPDAISFDGKHYRMSVSDIWQNEIAAEMADIKKFSKYLAAGLLIVKKETVA